MINIRKIKEVEIHIDMETEKKYIQPWYNDTRKLLPEEMEELLKEEQDLNYEVIKVELFDINYVECISTYRIKYMEN